MVTNYPIGDFLIRIKNLVLSGNKELETDASNLIYNVALTLKEAGVLETVELEKARMKVSLGIANKKPKLMDLKLISKPGLRIYVGCEELAKKRGRSYYILSTSKGVMTSKNAIKQNLGGEIIAEVW